MWILIFVWLRGKIRVGEWRCKVVGSCEVQHQLRGTVFYFLARVRACASTEDLLSQSFVRFSNEDDVLPSPGGHPSEAATPSSTSVVTTSSVADSDTDSVVDICTVRHSVQSNQIKQEPRVRPGHPPPFPPCPFTSSFALFFLFTFIGFTFFLLLCIPFLSTRIVPLRFQAGGRRKRPNLGLVCYACVICIP